MQAYPANDWYAPSAYLEDLVWILHAEEDVSLGFLCHKYDNLLPREMAKLSSDFAVFFLLDDITEKNVFLCQF